VAHSNATGASGSAESLAVSAGGPLQYLAGVVQAPVNGTVQAETRASVARPIPAQSDAAGFAGAAFVTALPSAGDYNAATASAATVRSSFGGISGVLGYGILSSTSLSAVPADPQKFQ